MRQSTIPPWISIIDWCLLAESSSMFCRRLRTNVILIKCGILSQESALEIAACKCWPFCPRLNMLKVPSKILTNGNVKTTEIHWWISSLGWCNSYNKYLSLGNPRLLEAINGDELHRLVYGSHGTNVLMNAVIQRGAVITRSHFSQILIKYIP